MALALQNGGAKAVLPSFSRTLFYKTFMYQIDNNTLNNKKKIV